jgi:hypothetical protein
MKSKKYIISLIILYLVGYIIYVYFFSIPKYNRLKESYILGICYSYGYSSGTSYKNNPHSIYYKYKIDGKEYKGDIQLNSISTSDLKSYLLFKTFPVAIDKKDYSNSAALIEPARFKDFKLNFPDSLEWILSYVKK